VPEVWLVINAIAFFAQRRLRVSSMTQTKALKEGQNQFVSFGNFSTEI
jgi:hypothetical protein